MRSPSGGRSSEPYHSKNTICYNTTIALLPPGTIFSFDSSPGFIASPIGSIDRLTAMLAAKVSNGLNLSALPHFPCSAIQTIRQEACISRALKVSLSQKRYSTSRDIPGVPRIFDCLCNHSDEVSTNLVYLGDFCITPRNGALGFNQASPSPTSREWDDGVWHREGVTRLTGAAYTLSNRRSSQAASPQEKKASEVLKRLPGCCFSLFLR